MFVGMGIVMTIVVGLFVALCATGIFWDDFTTGRWITTIILALAIGFGISGAMSFEHNKDLQVWNNGKCPKCNISWELADVVHYRNSGDDFYWSCPECKEVVKTNSNLK